MGLPLIPDKVPQDIYSRPTDKRIEWWNATLMAIATAVQWVWKQSLAYFTVDTDGTLAANSDTKIASQKATKTYADTKIASTYLDTDGTLAANSDTKIATQKATKTYADTKVPTSRTVNGHALTGDVTVTKSDVSLGNVTNVEQLPVSYLDTDGTLAANSDTKVASQKATKTYVDTEVSEAKLGTSGVCFFFDNILYTGENLLVCRIPKAFSASKVQIAVVTAPTGAAVTVDVNYHATDPTALTTIFTTQANRPSIAASGYTDDSGVPDVVDFAAGGFLGMSIDNVGSTIAGAKLMVTVVSTSNTTPGLVFFIKGIQATGDNQVMARVPKAFTLSKVQIGVTTAPTGAALTVDVHYHATDPTALTTVFTTGPGTERPSIAAGNTTDDSGTPDVTAIAAGGIIGICVDAVGSTIAGSDLMVTLVAA